MSAIRRILVPVDFSEPSRIALEYAAELARGFGAKLDVLHVWEAPTFIAPGSFVAMGNSGMELVEMVRTSADSALDDFVSSARRRGLEIAAARTEMGHPAHAITEAAARGGYDLLVLGTHGRSGMSHILLGSVAERVLRHAPCPVLTVPPSFSSAR
jgi:nucleotide-binding universal stress UspA family protein